MGALVLWLKSDELSLELKKYLVSKLTLESGIISFIHDSATLFVDNRFRDADMDSFIYHLQYIGELSLCVVFRSFNDKKNNISSLAAAIDARVFHESTQTNEVSFL